MLSQTNPFKKILAIDIGQGTQDILFYEAGKNIENCICLILPSPTAIYGNLVKNCSTDLYVLGSTIGGGGISAALKQHVKKGFRVYMEPEAAASIRDNLAIVESMGIKIGKPPGDFNGQNIYLKEVKIALLKDFLSHYGQKLDVEAVAIAVQDHGVSSEGKSDRQFRFEVIEKRLSENNAPESLAYWAEELPGYFTRMKAVVRDLKREVACKILVMDTASCAILGCLDNSSDPHFIVNVGNEHTLAAILNNGKIDALMEHHTHMLNPEKMRKLIVRFAKGEITKKEIFADGGHGALYLKKFSKDFDRIIVTGPNREKMRQTGLPVTFAAPGGNMMLTGPIGLVKACMVKRP